jgi:hypothetical protein
VPVRTQTSTVLIVAVEGVQHQANRRRWELGGCLTVLQLQTQVNDRSVSFTESVLIANNIYSKLLMKIIRQGKNDLLT